MAEKDRTKRPDESNLSARTDIDDSGKERPAGAAVTGPHGVDAPAVTGHDVPASEDNAVPPPDAEQDTTEQNLDRPAVAEERRERRSRLPSEPPQRGTIPNRD